MCSSHCDNLLLHFQWRKVVEKLKETSYFSSLKPPSYIFIIFKATTTCCQLLLQFTVKSFDLWLFSIVSYSNFYKKYWVLKCHCVLCYKDLISPEKQPTMPAKIILTKEKKIIKLFDYRTNWTQLTLLKDMQVFD